MKRFFAGVICVHLVAAWFNGGFLNADEHYQIIEFAQYKLGHQSPSALAWEFTARIRPALQPWLAAGIIHLCRSLGATSPFLIAFVLRVLSTVLALWVSLELCVRCLRSIERQCIKVAALGASFVLWIAPTVHSRFSSENWGAALLIGGVCLMLDTVEAWPGRRSKAVGLAVYTGLLWSAAFYCRFQIGVAIAGAGLWLLIVRRAPPALLGAIAASFVIGCGLNELVDRWLYDAWTLVPYNYFMVNLVNGRAALFGVSPWWMVAVYMAVILVPPYSLGLLAILAIGCWYARRHALVWVTIPFVFVHAVVPHKEPRFLIPLLYLIGPLCAVCVDTLPRGLSASLGAWLRTRWGRANVASWCAINVLLLTVAIVVPVNDTYRLDRWLWEHSRNGRITVYTVGLPPDHQSDTVTRSFYSSANVVLTPIEAADRAGAAFGACEPVVRTFPVWLKAWLEHVKWLADPDQSTICRLDARR